jgi:hypothetical protein
VKRVRVTDPNDIRSAVLSRIKQQGRSKYRFAVDCVRAGICQHHTVDELLSENASRQRLPSLPMAIALLQEAGLELVITPRKASNAD